MSTAAKASGSKKRVLVYVSRLSWHEAAAVFNVANVFDNVPLRNELLLAIREVAQDRVSRAAGCLALARKLQRDGDDESIRAAVNRAYYSTHHSIRAIVLLKKKSDPDDHTAAIKAFGELLNEPKFAALTGLKKTVEADVAKAMDNRHVADYSPYDESRDKLLTLRITGTTWSKAAEFNIRVAETLLGAARKLI